MRRSQIRFLGLEPPAGREWLLNTVDALEAQFGERYEYMTHWVGLVGHEQTGVEFLLDGFR